MLKQHRGEARTLWLRVKIHTQIPVETEDMGSSNHSSCTYNSTREERKKQMKEEEREKREKIRTGGQRRKEKSNEGR